MIGMILFALTACKAVEDVENPSTEELRNAFLLSWGAGLSTVIGAMAAFCLKKDDLQKERSTILAGCLSFAAAVMVYVSLIEIWPEAYSQFEEVAENEQIAHIYTSMTFFGGIIVGFLCSYVVNWFEARTAVRKPSEQSNGNMLALEMQSDRKFDGKNMTQTHSRSESGDSQSSVRQLTNTKNRDERKASLMRTGIITAISIALHNFPEGLVTFLAALADWKVGTATAFAIAIHNIPEGIAISIPYLYASESRWKAFTLAFLSGLAEPAGALIGWAILGDLWGHEVFGLMFGVTAGIMVYISFGELLPLARRNDPEDKITTISIFLGMFIMDLSLFAAA